MSRLKAWANEKRHERTFDVGYNPGAKPAPWRVDLENHATMATVHVDCHETLARAVEFALREATKEPAI